ncbi:BglG family transcription antiterminator [Radiobacillus deserti]|uniref:BglG family transcription antiterminator n=1 Tax=Radiobacillus deserti TaxID=2594883 RepID=UPI001E386402|nr:BglG family transcription antiterminator [Radiobacillus deserti]
MTGLYISGRERKILEFLLENDREVTIQEVAEHLDVSTRTIHRDLKDVGDLLVDFNLTLNKKSGVGISLEGEKEQKEQLEVALFQVNHTDYTPEERQAIVMSALLESHEPIKLFTLASELQVTIATVSNDLDKIADRLDDFDLSLIRRRGYGVRVDGKEKDKRAALSYLISQHVNEMDFLELIRNNIHLKSKQQLDMISNRLLGMVAKEKLYVIEKSVERVRSKLPYELADSAYIGIIVHLALALERLQKGGNIQFDPEYLNEIKETNEFEIARALIKDLEKSLHMHIPEDEIGYITMHLMGAKIRYNDDYVLEESSLDVAYRAKELIQYVGEQLEEDLNHHTRLFNDLVAHLKPTIYRLQQNMTIKNPLLEEIEQDYHSLFHVIEEGVESVFEGIKFPKEEIAYLVLHFASSLLEVENQSDLKALVICASGIGTSKMLASRLLQEIPEVQTVDNKSLFELDRIDNNSYDVIVSTVPLSQLEDDDYVTVSPILTKSEIHQVKKFVRNQSIQKRTTYSNKKDITQDTKIQSVERLIAMHHFSNVCLDLLSGIYVTNIEKHLTIEELLEVAGKQLESIQVTDNKKEVIGKLMKREEMGGMGVPQTALALFHTRSSAIRKPSLTFYGLQNPIMVSAMDGKDINMSCLILMLAPEEATEESLEVLGYISGLLVRDKESIAVFESCDKERISRYLSHQLNLFVNEKL